MKINDQNQVRWNHFGATEYSKGGGPGAGSSGLISGLSAPSPTAMLRLGGPIGTLRSPS